MFTSSLPAGIPADRLLGPYFLPLCLTGAVYRDFLRKVLPELLQDMDPQTGILLWFVHLPHFLTAVREFLNSMLPEGVEQQRGLLVHLTSVPCIFISRDISSLLFALQKSVKSQTCNNEYRTDLIRFVLHHHHPRCYNPCRVLTDSIISLHPSLSMAVVLQFLIPSHLASLFTPSIHLRLGLPTLVLPSGITRVIFLHGRLSCIRTMCPAHINLVFLIAVTRSISPYR